MARINGTSAGDFLPGTDENDVVFALGGNDTVLGGDGNDRIFGNANNDLLLGEDGNDTLRGGGNRDTLDGGSGDDDLGGGGDRDVLRGSFGNDIMNGQGGFDTADYSRNPSKITLEAVGVVDKGGVGRDQLIDIEKVIGANGERNLIDGTVPGGGPASFDVDLSAEQLQVVGIPGLGTASFEVVNFVDVNGTSNDDSLVGDSRGNVFGGSRGDDFIDGKGGRDTVDYSDLGQAVVLERAGVINKGSAGTDQIQGIETIVGAKGQQNAIDGSTGVSGTTSFIINLGGESLRVNGIPGLGSVRFKVENFVNATGTTNDDRLIGSSDANQLVGGAGNDFLRGQGGNDRLVGVDLSAANPGAGEVDVLDGGGGRDLFVLGESGDVFYTAAGNADFARIRNFRSGVDTVQLTGGIGDYTFNSAKTKIFTDGGSELVAQFNNGAFVNSDLTFA